MQESRPYLFFEHSFSSSDSLLEIKITNSSQDRFE